jgi:methylmalonyl-CoA mutase N-terminal domain/subunit
MEALTNEIEKEAYRYFDKIESMGGILNAVKNGYIQREIAATSYRRQKRLESGEEIMVGVNRYVEKDEKPINILKISKEAEKIQLSRLKKTKETRNVEKVKKSLDALRDAFKDEKKNVMPFLIDAAKSYATIEEISDVGREIYGGWKEPVIV